MPNIGNHVDAVFIPESVNTSTTLRITGGDLIVNTNDLVVDESTNRVGIGTNNPGSNLDIASTGFVNLKLRTTGNNSSTINLQNSQRNFSVNNVTGGSFTIHDGTASAERLRITSVGNVGIGTNSVPDAYRVVIKSSTSPHSALQLDTTESDYNTNLYFAKQGTNKWIIGNRADSDSFRFVAGSDERVRITSGGLVGIGTNGPNAELDIQSATDPKLRLESKESGNKRLDLWIDGGEAIGYIAADQSASQLVFRTTGTERLRINSTGLIGISESTPDSKVDILHSTSANPNTENLIHLRTDPGAGYVSRGLFIKIGRDANYDNSAAHYDIVGSSGNSGFHAFEVQGDEKLRITKDGKIGIGTATPGHKLEVAYTSDDDGFVVNHANRGGKWRFATSGSNAELFDIRRYDGANSTFRRYLLFGPDQFSVYTGSTTSATERLRITSNGNVGIGTDSPQSKLDINGTNSELRFYRDDRARFGGIRYDGTLLRVRLPQGDHLAIYNSTESLLGVIVKSTGEVGVGTIGPDEKLHVAGGSLKLDAISNLKFGAAGATGVALRDETNILGGSLDGTLGAVTMAYLASAPSSPVQGQFYFNSLSSTAQIYTGSSFVDLVPSGGGGGGGGGSSTDANATFRKYTYSISSTTNSVTGSSDTVVSAGSFIVGHKYTIKTVGTTTFTDIGASANTVGTVFTATGVGSGNGDAYETLFYSTGGNQNIEVYVNGVKAVEGSTNDYVATSGTSVNFVANLTSGDVVDVQVYELLTNDAYVLATGGTFTGNVGINTSTINNRLHIHSNANDQGILLTQAGSNYNGLIADANRNAADNYILNIQANWNGNGVARIALESGNDLTNKDDGRIKFSTSPSGSAPEVRMHIAPSGNVAIGLPDNTEAVAKLDVKGQGAIPSGLRNYTCASEDGFRVVGVESAIDLVGQDNGSHASSILFRNENEGFSIHNRPNTDSFHFKSFTTSANNFTIHDDGNISASVDIMSFTKAGLVGIGTTQPGANLQVEGHLVYLINRANTANTYFKAQNTGAGNAGIQMKNSQGEWIIIANDRLRFYDQDNTTERFSIASNGSIGINKTTPIAYGNSQATLVIEDDTNPALCLSDTGQTRDWFLVAHGDGLAVKYADGGNTGGASNVTNSAFFRNDGKVGIGTDAPSAKLHVSSTAGVEALVSGGGTSGDTVLHLKGNGNAFKFIVPNAASQYGMGLYDVSNSTYRMFVNSSGNVGIGEISPSRLLYVASSASDAYSSTAGTNTALLRLINKDGTDNTGVNNQVGIEMYVGTGATTVGMLTMVRTGNNIGDFTYKTRTGASSYAEHFRIKSNGAITIGTDTAASNSELTIRAASPHLALYATPGQDSRLNMGDTDNHDIGMISYANSDNSMRFTTNADERVRINSTGNVGIGTNGPGTKLDVNGVVKVHERTSGTPARIAMQGATSNMAPTARLEFWEGAVGTYSNAHASIEYDGSTDNGGDGAILIKGWTSSANQKIAVFSREGNVYIPSGRLVVNHQTSDLLSTHHFIAVGSKAAFQFDGNEGTWFGITNASANGAVTLEANARTGGWPPLHVKVGNNIALKLTSANGTAHFRDHIHFGTRHEASDTNTGRLGYFVPGTTAFGNTIQHSAHAVLTNEQGSTVQAMTLGDTSGGTDGAVLWAVSVNTLSVSDPDTTGQESGWSQKARVEGNGDFVHAGSLSSSGSDDRLKTNKVTISNALSKVQAMEGFSYEWNEVAEKVGMADDQTHLGLSAQTVEAVAPEVVVVNDTLVNPDDGTNDYKTIQYERLVPLLVEAIKEQQGIIDQLKQRLDDAGL